MADDDTKAKKPTDEDLDDEWGEEREDREDTSDDDSDAEESDEDSDDEDSDDEDSDDEDSDDEDDSDDDQPHGASASPDRGNGAVARAATAAAEAHDHGLAHLTPVKLLVGVFAALVVLTVATVAVTSFDLGSQGNFITAMIIATIKAGLVMAFFMHLVWDKKFNLTVFLSAFLFVLLFLSLTLTDRNEYQLQIDSFEADAVPAAAAAPPAPAGSATP
jgi:cytochrome c oxidase subunit 4